MKLEVFGTFLSLNPAERKFQRKIKTMINRIILFFLIFSFTKVKAQEENVIRIKSINGVELTIVDSLSYRDNLKRSRYYIESSSNQKYTGKAIVYYGTKAIDSIVIENGYENGWQKTYFIKDGNLELGKVRYLNQNQLMSVSQIIRSNLRNHVAFCYYLTEKGHCLIQVIYRNSGKIVLKELVKGENGKSRKKYRFSNLLDLELFFRKYHEIYPYCKKAGFFGEPEIE